MRLKTKMLKNIISVLCAATVATSGVVTSVGAVDEKEEIQQMKSNIFELKQKRDELKQKKVKLKQKKENLERKKSNTNKIKQLNVDINKFKQSINDSKTNRKEIIKLQSKIEKIKQERANKNRNIKEQINTNKNDLNDIKSQIKDARKQVKFMKALKELNHEITTFYNWNMSAKAGVFYTDVIAKKNIMILCEDLKNNFQAHKADAIIDMIRKSIKEMQEYRSKHKNKKKNNQKKLFKAKNDEKGKIQPIIEKKISNIPFGVIKRDNFVTEARNENQQITERKIIKLNEKALRGMEPDKLNGLVNLKNDEKGKNRSKIVNKVLKLSDKLRSQIKKSKLKTLANLDSSENRPTVEQEVVASRRNIPKDFIYTKKRVNVPIEEEHILVPSNILEIDINLKTGEHSDMRPAFFEEIVVPKGKKLNLPTTKHKGNIESEESDYSATAGRTSEDVSAETSAETNAQGNKFNILNVKNSDGSLSLMDLVREVNKNQKIKNGFLNSFDTDKGDCNLTSKMSGHNTAKTREVLFGVNGETMSETSSEKNDEIFTKVDTKIKEDIFSSFMPVNNNQNDKNDDINENSIFVSFVPKNN